MWGRTRASLFADTEFDIDIVNCHPNILRMICDELGVDALFDLLFIA